MRRRHRSVRIARRSAARSTAAIAPLLPLAVEPPQRHGSRNTRDQDTLRRATRALRATAQASPRSRVVAEASKRAAMRDGRERNAQRTRRRFHASIGRAGPRCVNRPNGRCTGALRRTMRRPISRRAPQRACLASASQVSTTVSGFSDMLSMLCSTSHCARSGWSDGPCPQMPAYLPGLAARA